LRCLEKGLFFNKPFCLLGVSNPALFKRFLEHRKGNVLSAGHGVVIEQLARHGITENMVNVACLHR